MLFGLLRSIFGRDRRPAPAASNAGVTPVDAPPVRDAEIAARLDEIRQRLAQIERTGSLQYQTQAALLVAQILADPRYADPLRLERHGRTVYSQNEEDGILAEIFRRVGTKNRCFLEFGAGNGLENNTACLLEQGWSGAWMDGYPDNAAAAERGFSGRITTGALKVRHALAGRDNIDDLIRGFALPRDLDLMSIDIDGNDYHVWEAITAVEPRVVVIEYNAKFPPPMRWVMRYDAAHAWDGSDQFGASLESLADLGKRKGYRLVGCNITGSNAFFVQAAIAQGRFAEPAEAAAFYHPARYFLSPAFISGHPPGYSRAEQR